MKRACVSGSEWWFIRYCGLHPPLSLPPLLPKHTRSHPRAGINLEERLTGLAAVVVVVLPLLIMGVRLAEDCMARPSKAKRNPGIRAALSHLPRSSLAHRLALEPPSN